VGVGLAGLLAGFVAGYGSPAADAAVTAFVLSPHAGPPGTVVQVSGAGCNPGLPGSAQTDFVAVTAAALGVVVKIPVHANGTWSGDFTVPATASSGAAEVAPICVSGALPSLTTIYMPQTFTVTAGPPTTPGTTTPPAGSTTPRTKPSDHPTTVFVPDDPSVVVGVPSTNPQVTSDSAGTDGTSPGAPGSTAGSHATSTAPHAAGNGKRPAAAGSATLEQADLGSYGASADDGGLGWLSWLLLLALVSAAGGATVLIWRARRTRAAATDGETV